MIAIVPRRTTAGQYPLMVYSTSRCVKYTAHHVIHTDGARVVPVALKTHGTMFAEGLKFVKTLADAKLPSDAASGKSAYRDRRHACT